ncbi:MAG: class I SAM-dependent methyltransferase [Planctomycetota bacterium]
MFETDYEYLDSGNGERLERVAGTALIRPAPMAEWESGLKSEAWQDTDLSCARPAQGEATWQGTMPDAWQVHFGSIRLHLSPSSNSQLGVFPEQQTNWHWVHKRLGREDRPCRILNGFAYTGAMTLAAASAGNHVEVCHLDGAKGAVNRARDNAALSGLAEHPIRWITEDALTFMEKEVKRGRHYDGLIFDPPAFGRGPKKKTWKLERDLDALLTHCAQLLSEHALFTLVSCHIPEWSPEDLAQRLQATLPAGRIEAYPLQLISNCGGHPLPLGICARWESQAQ